VPHSSFIRLGFYQCATLAFLDRVPFRTGGPFLRFPQKWGFFRARVPRPNRSPWTPATYIIFALAESRSGWVPHPSFLRVGFSQCATLAFLGRAPFRTGGPFLRFPQKVGLFPSAGATPKSFPMDTGNVYHFCTGGDARVECLRICSILEKTRIIRAAQLNSLAGAPEGYGDEENLGKEKSYRSRDFTDASEVDQRARPLVESGSGGAGGTHASILM
jgi:hypothetical protein